MSDQNNWSDAAVDVGGVGLEGEITAEELNVKQGQGVTVREPDDEALGGMIAGALSVTFGLLASRKGEHWRLREAEATEAGKAYAAVIEKYFPGFGVGPEMAAVMCTAVLVGPRLLMDAAKEVQEAEPDGDKPK